MKLKKYSHLIKPFIKLYDIFIINFVVFLYADENYLNLNFYLYVTIIWVIISYYTKFYQVYRYTHILKLSSLIVAQFLIFLLAYFAYFSIFKEGEVIARQSNTVFWFTIGVVLSKYVFFFFLKSYRQSGKNYRNVIIFGESKSAQNIASLFHQKNDLGYRFIGYFSNSSKITKHHIGTIKEGLLFAIENQIDEIYCELGSVNNTKLKEIRNFCTDNNIKFSIVPENKAIYSKDFKLEYYGTLPILKPKKLPFEKIETHIIKRFFDVLFSIFIVVFVLSWLLPILFILVKLNSEGNFFFKQLRDGANGKQFYCYKIRTMIVNDEADTKSTIKNDKRLTSFGVFLRKTSLDELPQFFNVLKGDMSVVGPRPHMNAQTKKYLNEVKNYIVRNSVKPGITGLAQVSGYRGEVKEKSDIENRVRLDIFYIENWSFFLDIKIIVQTFLSVFKGAEKAY